VRYSSLVAPRLAPRARIGFLRYPDGKHLVFDHPDAGTNGATGQGTRVAAVNALGAVAGSVRDANNFDIPFVRDPDGNYHNVNFSNFGGGDAGGINLWGVMVGQLLFLSDNNSPAFLHFHGFIRNTSGALTFFDPPGSQETDIPNNAINDFGAIAGDYRVCSADLSSCRVHGFIRTPNGKYITFDAPGAGPDGYAGGGTYPQGINNLGEVSGYYGDANSVYHGFWRDADGSITRFDFPKANYFTLPLSINDAGTITGIVYDPHLVVHGLPVNP
jgi:hypothetical protein